MLGKTISNFKIFLLRFLTPFFLGFCIVSIACNLSSMCSQASRDDASNAMLNFNLKLFFFFIFLSLIPIGRCYLCNILVCRWERESALYTNCDNPVPDICRRSIIYGVQNQPDHGITATTRQTMFCATWLASRGCGQSTFLRGDNGYLGNVGHHQQWTWELLIVQQKQQQKQKTLNGNTETKTCY